MKFLPVSRCSCACESLQLLSLTRDGSHHRVRVALRPSDGTCQICAAGRGAPWAQPGTDTPLEPAARHRAWLVNKMPAPQIPAVRGVHTGHELRALCRPPPRPGLKDAGALPAASGRCLVSGTICRLFSAYQPNPPSACY
ncbi:hypothetical protein NDU88_005655 [Pleurodeles waltl]|uniref:Uncharacterized protein n=1 Tax=Pleurodeles waltl TaxID=8319 RepID=A0AAV7L3N4_PLEWA|nr:hypothetical protein NDU88_005655 [Pleurodeles waltl]